jgi:hypothetical protein
MTPIHPLNWQAARAISKLEWENFINPPRRVMYHKQPYQMTPLELDHAKQISVLYSMYDLTMQQMWGTQ